MNTSTSHGWLDCQKCFGSCAIASDPRWKLVHNPGYWGAEKPSTLVLGFSKGQTQNSTAISSEFNSVAFAGMRSRLAAALVALGILDTSAAKEPDHLFRSQVHGLGFASLIRCSLLMRKEDDWVGSGTIMPAAAKSQWASRIIATCIREHLVPLPDSVSRIVLLGTTPSYVAAVTRTISEVFQDFMQINPMAFRAGGATWAFASHPSGANGHFNDWLLADPGTSPGRNREWAREALGMRAPVPQPSESGFQVRTRSQRTHSKVEPRGTVEVKKLIHPKPEARSKLVEQAEKHLYQHFDLINSTAKVAGFRLPSGRELLLLRGGNSLRVLTKPLSTGGGLRAPKLYAPNDPRNSNFKSCAPTLGPGHPAAQWDLQGFDDLQTLLKVAT